MKLELSLNALEQMAGHLVGNQVSFKVHYWGGKEKHVDNPLHSHSFFEACFVLSGKGVYWEAGETYTLQAGTVFCSRPGHLHQIYNSEDLHIYWVGFEVDVSESQASGIALFDKLAKTTDFFVPDAANSPSVNLWNALMNHAEKPPLEAPDLIVYLAYTLLLSLQTLFCKSDVESERVLPMNSSNRVIKQAMLFIRDNLAQPLSLEHIAAFLDISPRHLSRLFRQHGLNYATFVRRERVSLASQLIRSGGYSLKDIAEHTGFSSVYYFTKVFSEETGLSPGEYRKKGSY